MAALPIRDRAGNALVDFRSVTEQELACLVEQVIVPASLVVVGHSDAVVVETIGTSERGHESAGRGDRQACGRYFGGLRTAVLFCRVGKPCRCPPMPMSEHRAGDGARHRWDHGLIRWPGRTRPGAANEFPATPRRRSA
jgi:hypothetical protein